MKKFKYKIAFIFLVSLALATCAFLFPFFMSSAVLNPKGIIAMHEKNLIILSTVLMLIIVVPVLLMTFFICLRYRASNKKAVYDPNWDHNMLAEVIWWGFPFLIVFALSIATWISTYYLDPYRPLNLPGRPLTIQVVALQWKWLFIYPEQNIATVNFIQFPEKTSVKFEITADAPMNSLWIPQLGGQIYAMPGMRTLLHLNADEPGEFRGSSANLSGEGFAGMTFIAKASTRAEFDQWVRSVASSGQSLGLEEYKQLAKPSSYQPESFYVLRDRDLFEQVLMKFMMPNHPLQEIKP